MFKLVVFCGLVVCSLGITVPNGLQIGPRIIGGTNATIEQFPYQISLHAYDSHACGGSLWKPNIVITAAHCMRYLSAKDVKIRAGSTYKNRGGSFVSVSAFKSHPDFDTNTKHNDIAVLKLSAPLQLGPNIRTIELATKTPEDGAPGFVSGWGSQNFYNKKDPTPEYLQFAQMYVVSRDRCRSSAYAYGDERITPMMFCAAAPGKDSCQGDSGGPFAVNGELAGVISWGYGCAESMFPGVYTNIALMRPWIESTVKSL